MTLAIASARMTEGKTSATIFLPLGSAGESEPGSFQMIASVLEHVRFCVRPLRVESIFDVTFYIFSFLNLSMP